MNVARLAKIAGVCLGIFAVTGVADCQLAPAPKAGPAGAPPPISGYAAAREAMMKPAMEAMARRNYAASLDLFHVVLEEYPNDARALMLTANAAWAAGKWDEAADRYGEIVRQGVHYIWRDQLTLIRLDAGLGRWDDLERQDSALRATVKHGNPQTEYLKAGYVVEEFDLGMQRVRVIEYPVATEHTSTRYRFSFPDAAAKGHLDVEPENGETGAGRWTMFLYDSAGEKRPVASFAEIEPAYKDVRQRAVRELGMLMGATEVHPVSPYPAAR